MSYELIVEYKNDSIDTDLETKINEAVGISAVNTGFMINIGIRDIEWEFDDDSLDKATDAFHKLKSIPGLKITLLDDGEILDYYYKTTIQDIIDVINQWVDDNNGNIMMNASFMEFKDNIDFEIKKDIILCYGPKETLLMDLEYVKEEIEKDEEDFIVW